MAGRGERTTSSIPGTPALLLAQRVAAGVLVAAMLFPPAAALAERRPSPSATATPAPAATPAPSPTPIPDADAREGRQRDDRERKDRQRERRGDSRAHRTILLPELGRAPSSAPWSAGGYQAGSVRPRGAAAPVSLEKTPEPESAQRDGNDGKHDGRKPSSQDHRSREDAPREPGLRKSDDKPLHGRIWPMPAGTYTFTQEYGCVEQIGGFYAPEAGCPDNRPVGHHGIDLGAETGTLIYAAASGWVTEAGYDRATGLANTRLVIQHDGRNQQYATEYLHWITTYVEPGDYVRVGQPIAEVGSVGWSTGPHLHFAVIDFDRGDYVDPLEWLPRRESTAYRDLPRGARPVSFDHPDHSSAGVPDGEDPNPAPVPERTEIPDRSERVRSDERKERKAAHAERRAIRIEREADREERSDERRRRIRHADGETVVDDASAQPDAAPADPPRERDGRKDRARGDDAADSNRTSHSGRNDAGRDRRDNGKDNGREADDRGRNEDANGGGGNGGNGGESGGDGNGGQRDDGSRRDRESRSAEVESGDAETEPSLSARVNSLLEAIP